MPVQLFAVTARGPQLLPSPANARTVNEAFDGLSLGVYSALRTFERVKFLGLDHHLDRTDRSLELLGWPLRLDRPALLRSLDECVRRHPGPEIFVRFDVLAEAPAALGSTERTLLALSPLAAVPEELVRTGVVVRFSKLRRTRPLIKVASFVLERRPYPLGRADAYEHLLLDERGRLLEGTSSNFLAVQGRTLRLAGEEALQGVTQRIVSGLARELGLESMQAPVHRSELAELDEAFLTSSSRGIVPIVGVEELRIGAGTPGPWTVRLRQAYLEHARLHARPALG